MKSCLHFLFSRKNFRLLLRRLKQTPTQQTIMKKIERRIVDFLVCLPFKGLVYLSFLPSTSFGNSLHNILKSFLALLNKHKLFIGIYVMTGTALLPYLFIKFMELTVVMKPVEEKFLFWVS